MFGYILLPASDTWNDSSAYSIDAAGNIFGVAGGTYDGQTGGFAVEWSPVPEPATFTALAAGGTLLLARRRRAPAERLNAWRHKSF